MGTATLHAARRAAARLAPGVLIIVLAECQQSRVRSILPPCPAPPRPSESAGRARHLAYAASGPPGPASCAVLSERAAAEHKPKLQLSAVADGTPRAGWAAAVMRPAAPSCNRCGLRPLPARCCLDVHRARCPKPVETAANSTQLWGRGGLCRPHPVVDCPCLSAARGEVMGTVLRYGKGTVAGTAWSSSRHGAAAQRALPLPLPPCLKELVAERGGLPRRTWAAINSRGGRGGYK